MRQTVDGEFEIENNELSYRLQKPIPGTSPSRLKLQGNWSLDNEHNLVLTLDRENNMVSGDKITLEGEIIDAKANELAFCLRSKDINGQSHLSLLKLSGKWQADKYNRLSFLIQRERGSSNTLTFTGSWEINKKNELTYTFTKSYLKRKYKINHSITFKGYWDIREKLRLSYVLSKELDSGFEFQVSAGKPAPRGMEYSLGIGVAPQDKRIKLIGSWKVNPRLGLIFEMPYEEGRIRALVFGADCRLAQGTDLEFKLRNNLNKDLGVSLRLSKSVLGDSGKAFVEAVKERGNLSIFAGIGIRW